ncbi:hypothetical protein MRB53_007881 [Persea americana]|uniref:Uncharacterized protein n=1 Tax=Persea americana TaxID=3435 RepID=A0ACC2MKI2_PERAE|nr:hypothetical protein MRB53_007881 [Persea americana]
MAIESIRLAFLAIFYIGLTYGSRRSDLFMSHAGDMVHDPPDPLLLGICESFVNPQGYPCKEYKVTTEDGYILSMQNIPGGRSVNGSGGGRRQPVLLQHGLQMAYWAWSLDELVQYELPAIVGFVHNQTGQKMHLVGNSLGTLVGLASFSEGKLVDMLKSAALPTPIAYLSHMTSVIGQVAAKAFLGEIMTDLLGIPEFNPKGKVFACFLNSLCSKPGINCYDLMTSLSGKNCCMNSSTFDLFLKYGPQSTSTKTMVHLAQVVRKGVTTKFDYGSPKANIVHYSQTEPPVYNMSNIPNDLPLFLSYGGQDAISDVYDIQLLLDCLKFHDGDKLTVQFVKDFAHMDFVMGVTAKSIVYNAMIAFFNRY